MKNCFALYSYCILTVAIFLLFCNNKVSAQRLVKNDSSFYVGILSPSFGPFVSPSFDNRWRHEGGYSAFVQFPLNRFSAARMGVFKSTLTSTNADRTQANFNALTTYGTIIPFSLEWVPKIVLSPEIGLGFTSVEPDIDLIGVAKGSETELLLTAGFQLHSTIFGRFEPVLNVQYFRIYTYFEYDITNYSIGFRYHFNQSKRFRRWWRAGL